MGIRTVVFLWLALFGIACGDPTPAPRDEGTFGEDALVASDEDARLAEHGDGGDDDAGGEAADLGPGSDLPPYPGLPASCQSLFNHGEGGCVDTWVQPTPSWELRSSVETAAAMLDPTDATLFDADGKVPPGKRPAYAAVVAALLDAQGLCAAWDGQELYVHSGAHDYSESFRLIGASWLPAVSGHYQCAPADTIPGAPLPVAPPPQGCTADLIPSGTIETTPCQTMGTAGLYYDDITMAVLDVVAVEAAKGAGSLILDPAYTNLVFQSGWEDKGYRIRDTVFFLIAVAQRLAPLGYCYTHNGYDTILVKKNQARSEDFDLVQALGCGQGGQPPCQANRPAGNYVRYPGRGGFCALAEF